MLPLFPIHNGQLTKSREFVKLIGCGKVRFQAFIFFPEKKTVSLLFNEQSPIHILKTKNVNNIRFFYRPPPPIGKRRYFFWPWPTNFPVRFGFLNGNWLKFDPVFSGRNLLNFDNVPRLRRIFWSFWLVSFNFFFEILHSWLQQLGHFIFQFYHHQFPVHFVPV